MNAISFIFQSAPHLAHGGEADGDARTDAAVPPHVGEESGDEAPRRGLVVHDVGEVEDMPPDTAPVDPPFRRKLSRARSRLYGYLR